MMWLRIAVTVATGICFLTGMARAVVVTDLPEFVVESRNHRILHILAYVREYSTLTTYNDTIFLYREKMVDYMVPQDNKIKFNGWNSPRILSSKSYYRFTNDAGLDSVSDTSNHHFSWSDWIGISSATFPDSMRGVQCGSDTIWGTYSPAEIWQRDNGRVSVDVNVLADDESRKWVKAFSGFFKEGIDFDRFRIKYNYDNVVKDTVTPLDLTGYSFNIESTGRGHDMFRFGKRNQPFFVSTYGEVYVMEKEFITAKEAKQWQNRRVRDDESGPGIYPSPDAPALQPSIISLISRVEHIDKEEVRLAVTPDARIGYVGDNKNYNLGYRILNVFKDTFGLTAYRSRKKMKKQWRDTKREILEKNRTYYEEEIPAPEHRASQGTLFLEDAAVEEAVLDEHAGRGGENADEEDGEAVE